MLFQAFVCIQGSQMSNALVQNIIACPFTYFLRISWKAFYKDTCVNRGKISNFLSSKHSCSLIMSLNLINFNFALTFDHE